MRYQPLSEEDANDKSNQFALLKDGDYPFEVLEAEDKTSKNGNEYIKTKLGVAASPGRQQWVWCNLVPAMEFQLRHLCESTGLLAKYATGQLTARDCIGRTGIASIITKKQDGYEARNEVKDFVVKLRDIRSDCAGSEYANDPRRQKIDPADVPPPLPAEDGTDVPF